MKSRLTKKAACVGGMGALLTSVMGIPAFGQSFQSNLLLNPFFDTGSEPTTVANWSLYGACQFVAPGFDTPTPNSEPNDIWFQTFNMPAGGIYQDVTGVEAGTNYTLSNYFYFEAGYTETAVNIDLQMIWEDSNGNQIGNADEEIITPESITQTGAWIPYSITGTAPAGTTQILAEFDQSSGGATVIPQESQSVILSDTDLSGIGPPPPANAWQTSDVGDWNGAGNWSSGVVPNGAGFEVDFYNAITSNTTVVINNSPGFNGDTAGFMHFNSSNNYAIAGTGTLYLQGTNTSPASIEVDQSTAEIELPLVVGTSATFDVASGANLIIANTLNVGAGDSITQTGGGTVTYQSIVTLGAGSSLAIGNPTIGNTLSVGANAKVTLTANTNGTPNVVQFNNVGLVPTAGVDLTNNILDVNYGSGADPISTIRGYLASGYHNGAWNGPGILSSTVASLNASSSLKYAVGYIDGALPPANYHGAVPASGTIEIMPTLAGDATLSGTINFYDFQAVLSNFGKSGQSWDQGDFDYTSTVDFYDFQVVLSNFGKSDSALLTSGQLAELNNFAAASGDQIVEGANGLSLVSVPEPASIGLLAIGSVGLLRRRKNRCS